MNPPNPYADLPQVASTSEADMDQGELAAITEKYFRKRKEWDEWLRESNTTKSQT